jgi:hypothetical protein
MRSLFVTFVASQLSLLPRIVDHPHARELSRVSALLDALPLAAELVAKDLTRGTEALRAGRAGNRVAAAR